MDNTHKDIARGLLYTHARINDLTAKDLEGRSFLYALIELLEEKGVLKIEDLDKRKQVVAQRLFQQFKEKRQGLMYSEGDEDKYAFSGEKCPDCPSRVSACKAACCRLPFALSKQDIDEDIVHWEFKRPYLIAHDEDGYCVHLDRDTYKCAVHENRPVACRGFDCRDNKKWQVWEDYDKKQIHPDLDGSVRKWNDKFYELES